MATVADLINRIYRSYLHPGDDQPARALLANDITAEDTTWTYRSENIAADELELFAPGIIVEADREQALVTHSNPANIGHIVLPTGNVTVLRGYNGTARTGHDADTPMTVQPPFARQSVFDAVADNIVNLYPTLYHVATEQITTAPTPVQVPAPTTTIASFTYPEGTRWIQGNAKLLNPFPPSPTGKAVTFNNTPHGRTGNLTYHTPFNRPTTEADDLQTLGVDASWERIIAVGTAAQVLSGRELDSVQQQYITEQLRAEGYPVLTAMRQAGALWEVRDDMLQHAARNLQASNHTPVTMNTI